MKLNHPETSPTLTEPGSRARLAAARPPASSGYPAGATHVQRKPPDSIQIGARKYRTGKLSAPLSDTERFYFLAALHPVNLASIAPHTAPDAGGNISYLANYPAHIDPGGKQRMRVTLHFDQRSNLCGVSAFPQEGGRAALVQVVMTPLPSASGMRGARHMAPAGAHRPAIGRQGSQPPAFVVLNGRPHLITPSESD